MDDLSIALIIFDGAEEQDVVLARRRRGRPPQRPLLHYSFVAQMNPV
jgi:hypothetical protein